MSCFFMRLFHIKKARVIPGLQINNYYLKNYYFICLR